LWHDCRIVPLLAKVTGLIGACSLLLLAACSSRSKAASLTPLAGPSWRVPLTVEGFGAASVAVPLGATTPRPIVVVLHGERDRAEWQCGSFRGVLGARAFVLCPAGQAADGGSYGWGSFDETAAELRAALKALKARYGAHVAKGSITLVGYGVGADHAVDLARQEPSFFARVALVSGDPARFSPSASKIFAERGGKRALFFCTSAECERRGAERAVQLQRSGAQAKAVRADVGPYLDQRFTDALKGEMEWLFEGDSRFSSPRR
jgi:pimeloyl-ACP methyl ester carboxylesterase